MPITPFHFGPGLLFRSVAPRRFSWTMFVMANIAIDIEPVTNYLLTGDPAHGYLHTYLGATVLGLLCAIWGRPLAQRFLIAWNRQLSERQAVWLGVSTAITPLAALTGTLLGAWSHIFFDSIMHADVRPFWPVSIENEMLGFMPLDHLHMLCIASGIAGALLLIGRRFDWVRQDANRLKAGWVWPTGWSDRLRKFCVWTSRQFLRGATILAMLFFIALLLHNTDLEKAKFDPVEWIKAENTRYSSDTNMRFYMAHDLVEMLRREKPGRDELYRLLGSDHSSAGKDRFLEQQSYQYMLGSGSSWFPHFLDITYDEQGIFVSANVRRD